MNTKNKKIQLCNYHLRRMYSYINYDAKVDIHIVRINGKKRETNKINNKQKKKRSQKHKQINRQTNTD